MVFIYVLKLEEGKYYIGKTDNPQFRLETHFNDVGSAWTQKYKPLKVLELLPNKDNYDEDKITRQYMDKYGIANVRGGAYVKVNLDQSTLQELTRMSNSTNNKCFTCGKSGHFAKECEESKNTKDGEDGEDSDGWETCSDGEYEEVWCCEYCDKEFIEKKECEYHEKYCKLKYKKQNINQSDEDGDSDEEINYCFRCGRTGHYSPSCYASKHIKGYYLKK